MDKFKPGAILPDFKNLTKHNGEPIIDLPKRKPMIKANELKIGNWVKHDDKYYGAGIEVIKVEAINKKGLEVEGDAGHEEYCYLYENLEPIELTPEILEKAGFKNGYEDDKGGVPKGTFYLKYSGTVTGLLIEQDIEVKEKPKIHLIPTGKWNVTAIGENPYDGLSFDAPEDYEIPHLHIDKIQYLHQLQNLYFALTGEELTINL